MFRKLIRKAIVTIALAALTLPVPHAVAQSATSGSVTATSSSPANPTSALTGTDPVPPSPGIIELILSVLISANLSA